MAEFLTPGEQVKHDGLRHDHQTVNEDGTVAYGTSYIVVPHQVGVVVANTYVQPDGTGSEGITVVFFDGSDPTRVIVADDCLERTVKLNPSDPEAVEAWLS